MTHCMHDKLTYWLYRRLRMSLGWLQAGIETLMFAMKKLPQLSDMPDAIILNMGIWVRDWSASGSEYKNRFQVVMQHGNYFVNHTPGAPPKVPLETLFPRSLAFLHACIAAINQRWDSHLLVL